MRFDSSVCGYYATKVALRDEPLRGGIAGGDRTVGEDDGFALDACSSQDPDDPTAQCHAATGSCEAGIAFEWACGALTAINSTECVGLVATPTNSSCRWLVSARQLGAGRYRFTASISKPASGETIVQTVIITVEAGRLPTVTIAVPAALKQNPTSKLTLYGTVALPDDGAQLVAHAALTWSIAPADVDLAVGSSTGVHKPNLVLRQGKLVPGATYTFSLTATARNRSAVATTTVLMNRAPFGGDLTLQYTPPAVALSTEIVLMATGWHDEPEDMPLRYAFSCWPLRSPADATGVTTPLSKQSVVPSTSWLAPEGNWTVAVSVTDVFGAASTAEHPLTVGAVVLSAAKAASLLESAEGSVATGDVSGALRLAGSLADALNQQAAGSRAAARLLSESLSENGTAFEGDNGTALSDNQAEAARITTLRDDLMSVVGVSADGATQDAESISQVVAAVDALVGGDCQNTTLAKGTSILATMVGGARGEAGLAGGVPERMASAIGTMLSQGFAQARAAISEGEGDGSSTNATSDTKRAEVADRAAELVNVTSGLTRAIGKDLVAGEATVSVQSPQLAIGVSKSGPCDLDAASSDQRSPALANGVAASFALPPASLCATNGSSSSGGSSSTCDNGDLDDSLEVGLSVFGTNPYATSGEDISTGVADVRLTQCGSEKKIQNAQRPMAVALGFRFVICLGFFACALLGYVADTVLGMASPSAARRRW